MLLLMVAVAFILRVILILVLQSYEITPLPRFRAHRTTIEVSRELMENFSFGFEVGSVADSVARGEGFNSPFGGTTGPTAWLGPIYPYLCAGAFWLLGSFTPASAFLILTLNSLFSALTCLPIVLIGVKTLGRHVAMEAGWLWATLPWFMQWPTTWIWEMALSGLLISLLLLLSLHLGETCLRRKWAGFGALWGLAALTNPALLSFLPASLAWPAYRLRRQGHSYLFPATLAVLVCLVVISPWLIRNRLVMKEWVFIRSNFWYEFSLSNYHGSNGMGWGGKHPSINILLYDKYQRLGELGYIAAAKRESLAFLRRHPDEFLQLSLRRLLWFWDGTYLHYSATPVDFWTRGIVLGFSLFSFLGLLLAFWRRVDGAGLLALLLLFYPAIYYITYPQGRYRHAIEPVLLLLTIYLLSEMTVYLHNRVFSAPQKVR